MSVDQLYLARPTHLNPSYSSPLRGLYLCGSGAHPGRTKCTAVCTLLITISYTLTSISKLHSFHVTAIYRPLSEHPVSMVIAVYTGCVIFGSQGTLCNCSEHVKSLVRNIETCLLLSLCQWILHSCHYTNRPVLASTLSAESPNVM